MDCLKEATVYARGPTLGKGLALPSNAHAHFDELVANHHADVGSIAARGGTDHESDAAAGQAPLHDASVGKVRAEYKRVVGESIHQSTIAAGLVTSVDAALLRMRMQMAPLRRVHNGGSRLESQI